MNVKELSLFGEMEYASTPSSGRGSGDYLINKEDIIKNLKPIALRKPMIMIVGSVATQGKSNNDLDIVVRGEDLSPQVREAIDFRLYRYFSDIFGCKYDETPKKVHIHYNNTGSYTSYIPLFELCLMPMSNTNVIPMSKNDNIPVQILGNFDIIKKNTDGKRIIAGYASVIEVDQQNHIIPKSTLEDGVQTLLKNSDYANLMLVHKNVQIGKIIPAYGSIETHVDDKGFFIVAEIREDLQVANKVWEGITNGAINSFSISGEVLFSHDECNDEKCVRVIDKLNIFEVSVCSAPINKNSGFVVISKGDTVCTDVVNKLEIINMSNEMQKEVQPGENKDCPDCVTKEEPFSVKDAIDAISRELTALKGVIEELRSAKPKEENPMPAETPPKTDNPQNPDESKYPLPEEKPKSEESTPPSDMVSLSAYTDFMKQYLADHEGATVADAADAWKKKQGGEPSKEAPAEVPSTESPSEEPSKYPYPSKKDYDELKQSVDTLLLQVSTNKKVNDMEITMKAKDAEINALLKRIDDISKVESTPKTTVAPIEPTVKVSVLDKKILDKTGDLTAPFEGDTKLPEPQNVSIIKDPLSNGVFYRDPDL